MSSREPPLTPLEIASGVVAGNAEAPLPVSRPGPRDDPFMFARAGFDAAIRSALMRPPCLVTFSGGLDSSTVLAAAVAISRAEGLPEPIPVTWRFADVPESDESDWQEAVAAELALDDWVRLEGGEDLDFVGPVAARLIAKYGVRYPANAHLHLPVIERASGGSLLTGVGGDEILGGWRWSVRGSKRGARARVPTVARRLRAAARDQETFPWLRPAAGRVARWRATDDVADPREWSQRVAWQATRRRLRLGLHTLDVLGADANVQVTSPLTDAAFLGGAAQTGGDDGLGGRREALLALMGDVVPRALESRTTKTRYGAALWRSASNRLAGEWRGGAPSGHLVDATELLRIWGGPVPRLATALLLQSVLANQQREGGGLDHM